MNQPTSPSEFALSFLSRRDRSLELASDARAALARTAVDPSCSPFELAERAQRIIGHEAAAAVLGEAAQVADFDRSASDDVRRAAVLRWAARRLARGADDKWSGRNNDDKRVAFEAVCSAIDLIVEGL